MTQIIGTPRNIPIKPKKCPKTVIESKTQNGEIPTTSPKIFGPKNKPSNCCCRQRKTFGVIHVHWKQGDQNTILAL